MRSRAVAMLCVLVLVVTGCGGKKGGGGPQTTELEVTASDTACTVAKTTLPAGRHTFAVTNKGTKVTEFYVYGAGDRVVGEVENVSPGLRRTLVVDLTAGEYQAAAVQSYRQYVQGQADSLVTQTAAFVAAIKAGDIDKAKSLYPFVRTPYERIEPVAESFGDLDPKIDAREDDV